MPWMLAWTRQSCSLAETGAVTAASAMVCPPRWREAARALARCSSPIVGLHFDLTSPFVEGEFPAQKLPRLMAAAHARLLDRAALRREVDRQLSLFEKGMGRAPDFADGHQHVHHLPVIREVLLEALDGPLWKRVRSASVCASARPGAGAAERRQSSGGRARIGFARLARGARPPAELRFCGRLQFRSRCQSSGALARLDWRPARRIAAHHVPRRDRAITAQRMATRSAKPGCANTLGSLAKGSARYASDTHPALCAGLRLDVVVAAGRSGRSRWAACLPMRAAISFMAPSTGLKLEAHGVLASRYLNGAEQDVGTQNLSGLSIDAAEPPGVPDIVQNHKARFWAIDLDLDLGVFVGRKRNPGVRAAMEAVLSLAGSGGACSAARSASGRNWASGHRRPACRSRPASSSDAKMTRGSARGFS